MGTSKETLAECGGGAGGGGAGGGGGGAGGEEASVGEAATTPSYIRIRIGIRCVGSW